ncbi:integrase [Methanorbis furvi]|uniref:Integrase SSV1 C-terminal domain-containing protein n=1 Tax=Methanorbis furvi TaxID=3028299 RepID=A0AAE4SA37_9EURY|nr:hypothetical protein [Methanocorpusculaceae archaeon Ag1]
MTVTAFYALVEDQYLSYCDAKGLAGGKDGRKTRYHNALSALRPIYSPDDRRNYANFNEGDNISQMGHNALMHFFKFCQEILGLQSFNGYGIDSEWCKKGMPYGGAKTTDESMTGRFYDLTNAEIRAGLEKLPGELKGFYALLAYSGARGAQLFDALTGDYDREIKRIPADKEKNIKQPLICLDVRDMSRGKKRAYYYFFPPECEALLRAYQVPYQSMSTMGKKINELTQFKRDDENRACNVNSLRKWQTNLMLNYKGPGGTRLSDTDIDLIQGRVPDTVLRDNYQNKLGVAAAAYSEIVDTLRATLPIPQPITKSNNKFGQIPKGKKEEIIDLYKKGTSERKIHELTGVARNTISNILVESGMKEGKIYK